MDTSDILTYAAVGVGAYVVYKRVFESPLSQPQGDAMLERAGLDVTQSKMSQGASIAQTRSALTGETTTFKFLPGEYSQLNGAQRILISADRFVPGTWLTRMVLT